jgi:glycosyltransferase involved in cell wall biosynthesis
MKKRILIFGPIGDVGGRELETGFIASLLSKKYIVDVLSSRSPSKLSQVLSFTGFSFTSLNSIILKRYFLIKCFIWFVRIIKGNKDYSNKNISNPTVKKIFRLELKKKNIIKEHIRKSDVIFICAQLTSAYVEEIINYSKTQNKKIIFRTTGLINKNFDIYYLDLVDLYIHHSRSNASQLLKLYNFKIIDQCSFNETSLINIPLVDEKINNFMTVCRIDKTKNLDVVIDAFIENKDLNNRLYVVGNGPYLEELMLKTSDKRVIFTGFIDNKELYKIFTKCQCFIVSYYKLEAGPITGIEAMASGRIIISSKTGAMPERLTDSNMFWHNNKTNNLKNLIRKVKLLDKQEIREISKSNRNRYLEFYSDKIIRKEYLEAVDSVI